jgi:hypothetical protein
MASPQGLDLGFIEGSKRVQHGSLERRQIVRYRTPDRIQIDAFISMAKLVSDPPDIPLWQIWNAPFRFVPEPDRSFADYLQFTLNGGDGHGIRAEHLEVHRAVNCSIIPIASRMSVNRR